jgi:predicted cupin superfamily sugar epimerase
MLELNQLIDKLNLKPHPEGGYYSETYRSLDKVSDGERNLMTCIYFLLTENEVSKFHRIKSDELWFYHQGSPIDIHLLSDEGHQIYRLGPIHEEGCLPQILVKKNTIFGSCLKKTAGYSLVSCVVAPGFDFRDFELFNYQNLIELFPDHQNIISRLT